MTIALVSTARRLAVFLLPHESYCRALGRCACTKRRDGAMLAASLTMATRARVPSLPEAVLSVPAIARAVRDGSLRVEPPTVPVPAT